MFQPNLQSFVWRHHVTVTLICLNSEGHKRGGRLSNSFTIEMEKNITLKFRYIEIDNSSSARTVHLAKP